MLATYLEVALGNTKYNHQYSGITNKRFMFVNLDHGSRTSESDPSIFYNLSSGFAHKLHYFVASHLPRRGIRNKEKSSLGEYNSK
jgi:hypothetical protein